MPSGDARTKSACTAATTRSASSRVRGRGSLDLGAAQLSGSPLLSELVDSVAGGGATSLDLAPMSFTIDGGRLAYAEPWRWKIDGVDTFFSGGLAPDGTLDLAWEVPM